MSYYEHGYGWCKQPTLSGDEYGNWSVKQSGTHEGLCILKYKFPNSNQDVYAVVCGNHNHLTPTDPDGIYFDIINWINGGNSLLYYIASTSWGAPDAHYTEDGMYQRDVWTFRIEDPTYDFWCDNLPIFTVTSDDVSAFNNYLDTGDDSGADNYEDLHPVQLHTDVWLDGKYPSVYLKTEIVEGELNRQINVKIVGNVSSYSPIELYNKNVPINEMVFLTFADYGNVESVNEYEFQFCRSDKIDVGIEIINWGCVLDFALDNNTGTVISPTTHDSRNGYHTISVEEGVPTDEDYEDENDEWKHNQTHNGFSGANTLTKTYMLNDTKLRALGNFLWSSTFKDNIFSLTQYPLDNIVSLKAMPLISQGTESEIKIGNVATGINAPVISLSDGIETTVGECVVDRVFKNFIDFSDFEMTIYLPFIGFKSIDPSLCMNRKLRVKYYFDTILGNCLATLEMADSNGNYIMYNAWQGNCGIDIAITATNRAQIENGYIGSALNAIGSLLSKNPLSFMGDVFKATTQEFHSESNGVGNPSLMNKLDTTCYIFVKRPQKYTPSHYGHHFGVPWYDYVDNLSSCHGFTKTHEFVCSEIRNALDGEKAEIEQLLNDGVFFD